VTRVLPRSLQARLLLLVLGLVLGVWAATAVMTWFDARHELDELLDAHLAQAAALLVAHQVREIEVEEDEDEAHERHRGLDATSSHRYAPRVAFQVFHDGRLVLRSSNAPLRPMMEFGGARPAGFATVDIEGTRWRMLAAQGRQRGVQVLVGEQLELRGDILLAVLRGTLWPLALALPLLALAVVWAVRRGMLPLRRLGRTLAARNPRALEAVDVPDAPAEMAPMLDALNQLFARIATMLDLERRFTADAAHELRTPIAAIRAQAQVALGGADDSTRRNALERTLEGCDRASHLVDQLLVLSRLDAEDAPELAALDLSELVRGVAAELAPHAIRKDQVLELDAPQACRVHGNRTLLEVLVRNLIDNAVRYSPSGARVAVSVHAQGSRAWLRVQDSGPGLSPGELARLGERFFRVSASGASGSGLGWSIVRRITEVHGAQIDVQRSAELGGLAVRWSCARGD